MLSMYGVWVCDTYTIYYLYLCAYIYVLDYLHSDKPFVQTSYVMVGHLLKRFIGSYVMFADIFPRYASTVAFSLILWFCQAKIYRISVSVYCCCFIRMYIIYVFIQNHPIRKPCGHSHQAQTANHYHFIVTIIYERIHRNEFHGKKKKTEQKKKKTNIISNDISEYTNQHRQRTQLHLYSYITIHDCVLYTISYVSFLVLTL